MRIKALGERWILRLIIIMPLVTLAILTVVITSFYIEKMNTYFQQNNARYMSEYIAGEKRKGEVYVNDIVTLADFITKSLDKKIKKELDERLFIASNSAEMIYRKYHKIRSAKEVKEHILDALSAMTWYGEKNYVFVTDYEGNNILSGSQDLVGRNISDWEDADGRAIILEEIQVARKYGEGYIETRFRKETGVQIIKVKDFGHYNWFFGTGIHKQRALQKAKKQLLELIESAPQERSGFIGIFEKEHTLYLSDDQQKTMSDMIREKMPAYIQDREGWRELPEEKTHIFVRYVEAFDWYIVYGFKEGYFTEVLQAEQTKSYEAFEQEVSFIIEASAAIALLVGLLSFIVSRRIIVIIEEYKEELEHRETELRELNHFLEARVREEVAAHRKKEKMLIQQSKMAAMGDMISLIAHQWRQPLNQMSYVLMNIDAAYEYKELTPEYLEEKVKEGTKLLEYMSHTIDDFKNFFRPDKARSEEQISEVMRHTVSLVKKSLDAHKITLETDLQSDASLKVYRNELLQVILNLITNAKDAVVMNHVLSPKIILTVIEEKEYIEITVCDNGGGVADDIKEKIFEPYFSTKGEQRGSGLGLYMAKTIVEEHLNGIITVEEHGDGACFIIRLRKEAAL